MCEILRFRLAKNLSRNIIRTKSVPAIKTDTLFFHD